MTDPGHAASLWTDRSFLRDVQYKTDVNLAARQSIYSYQEPPIDLARRILSLAGLSGYEVVADIGCGNGLGEDHLGELRDVVVAALASLGRNPASVLRERISLDQGEALLRSAFESVTRHDFAGQLQVPGPEPVVAYVRSMRETSRLPDPEPLVEAVADRLQATPGAVFRVTTHSGCLVCA